jgi:uncharacterized Zn-binding protein involved in type VI secretion
MKNLSYTGVPTSDGGKVLTDSNRIQIQGRSAARIGDELSCPIYGDNAIVEGSSNVGDGTVPLSRDSDRTQCGAIFIAPSHNAQAH